MMLISNETVGQQVRRIRKRRGWTQTELGKNSGLVQPAISRLENHDDCTIGTLIKVAVALGKRVNLV